MKRFLLFLVTLLFIGLRGGVDIELLKQAWALSAKSKATNVNNLVSAGLPNIPYYSLQLPEYSLTLSGERPWHVRWHIIKTCGVDFDGGSILEIGCNMGLLSTYLSHEFKPKKVVGIDHDLVVVNCAQMVARAFQVSPIFLNLNIDDTEVWQKQLGNDFDVVFLLSVFKYFKEPVKKKFLEFLVKCNFPVIIYEGDKFVKSELETLASVGYSCVRSIGMSERKRPMFVISCSK